jgi:hypothetical protein
MHEPEHNARSVAGPFVKPVPGSAPPTRATGTSLPAMHPPPFLPSRRTPILVQPVAPPSWQDAAAPREPESAAPHAPEAAAHAELEAATPRELEVTEPPTHEVSGQSPPEAVTSRAAPDLPTPVEWVDAMPAVPQEMELTAERDSPVPDEPAAAAGHEAIASSADIAPADVVPHEAARLLRTLADRIDARELRLPPLPNVRTDAALLTIVLAAVLAADGPGGDEADAAPSAGASSPRAR